MREPLVSITVPVYNVEKYLPRCLESLMRQTLTHIEIICVNDGSTDGSRAVLEKYRKKDRRIRIVDKKNGGLPSARNAAMNVARGKYVGFVDSDDYVESDMFRRLYETAERERSEVVICGAQIFPQEPDPGDWLRQVLNPSYRHYESFEPELLFEGVPATPFLWRVLASRDLIEREHLRLEESILLGEDKAFQAKLYTKAKGITLIPDKLYHYCWYREGSMMQQDVYRISTYKGKGHAKLIRHMAGILEREDEKTRRRFLEWSIPFLYADYIYLTLEEKTACATELVEAWIRCGYYSFRRELPGWITEQFTYFEELSKEKGTAPRVSVVIPINDKGEYVSELLESLGSQSLRELEILIINSGAPDETYAVLHKNLFRDKRIRLYNMSRGSYARALNVGINLACGEYVQFADHCGWYGSENALEEWYRYVSASEAEICASEGCLADDRGFAAPVVKSEFRRGKSRTDDGWEASEGDYYHCDLHNLLYRREFLQESGLAFQECSLLTGQVFVLESLMKAHKKVYWKKPVYLQRRLYRQDWISTKKCEEILETLGDVMEEAGKEENGEVQGKILGVLNGDYYKKMIINNTKGYVMQEWQCPNGENSQVKTVRELYRIMQGVRPELLEKAGYDLTQPYTVILCELMRERHRFLAEVSNRVSR